MPPGWLPFFAEHRFPLRPDHLPRERARLVGRRRINTSCKKASGNPEGAVAGSALSTITLAPGARSDAKPRRFRFQPLKPAAPAQPRSAANWAGFFLCA
jgi:hypothetical protein